MFPMTVTINNPAQLNAVMAALNVADIEPAKIPPCAGTLPNPPRKKPRARARPPPRRRKPPSPKPSLK